MFALKLTARRLNMMKNKQLTRLKGLTEILHSIIMLNFRSIDERIDYSRFIRMQQVLIKNGGKY